jgi:hypothetical protein
LLGMRVAEPGMALQQEPDDARTSGQQIPPYGRVWKLSYQKVSVSCFVLAYIQVVTGPSLARATVHLCGPHAIPGKLSLSFRPTFRTVGKEG